VSFTLNSHVPSFGDELLALSSSVPSFGDELLALSSSVPSFGDELLALSSSVPSFVMHRTSTTSAVPSFVDVLLALRSRVPSFRTQSVGSTARPTKSTVPVGMSRMKKKKGRLTIMFFGDAAIDASRAIAPVAAAATVPLSVTETKAW
jgi:hypothetical protein